MNLSKLNKLLIYFVSGLLLLDVMDAYYGIIIIQNHLGSTPSHIYGIWIQGLIKSLVIIILLNINRLSFIGYLWLILSSCGYLTEHGFNPLYWLHKDDIQYVIGLILELLELIFGSIGLVIWLWIKFHDHKPQ